MKRILLFFAAAFAVLGVHAQDQERKGDLKVMTYNIRYATMKDGPNAWIYRKDASIAMIKDQQPDVIAMQEVLFKQKKYFDIMLFEFTNLLRNCTID